MTSASPMHQAGHSKPVLWTTEGDGVGKEVGVGFRMGASHVHPWLIHADVWQNPPQYCKVTILQLNNF